MVDLSQYAGQTINNFNIFNSTGGAAGNWDIYFGDITLVHSDGTFIPIYSRSMMSLSPFQGPAESNLSVITEKVADMTPFTTTTYYHGDLVGSTQLLTAGTGWPVGGDTYYPYGQGPMSGTNHYLFTGKERDTESGLDYFGARYYASSMGRFMRPDWASNPQAVPYATYTNPQSLNLYNYMRNNPLSGADPDGHCCLDEIVQTISDTVVGGVKGIYNQAATVATMINRPIDATLNAAGVNFQFSSAPAATASTLGQQSAMYGVDAAAILIPTDDLAKGVEMLSDSALVVRGGVATPEQLTKGAETISADGKLSGVSVQSANGATVDQLSQGLKNNQVSVTTVGHIRSIGGDVKPTPSFSNPNHCDMCYVDANQASNLFKQQRNPAISKP